MEGVSRHGRATPVVARLLEGEKMAPLCAEFAISRKTEIYDPVQRRGIDALTDRSRRPLRQAGAPKIREKLHQQSIAPPLPSDFVGRR